MCGGLCCVSYQVRRIGSSAVGGFAGVAVDGLALLERLEGKLEEHPGQLQRAAVELAKMWRQVGNVSPAFFEEGGERRRRRRDEQGGVDVFWGREGGLKGRGNVNSGRGCWPG